METKIKKTKGRQKIEIKKIHHNNNRYVAFSKRRLGLFNKASELCVLCGTQVAVIVQSCTGKHVFTFGHPSADAVIDRYLTNAPPPPEDQHPSHDRLFRQARQELEAAKAKIKEEEDERKGGECGPNWWDLPIEGMNAEELREYTAALEELKKKAELRVEELETAAALIPSSSSSDPNPMNSALMNNDDDFFNNLDDQSNYYIGFYQN